MNRRVRNAASRRPTRRQASIGAGVLGLFVLVLAIAVWFFGELCPVLGRAGCNSHRHPHAMTG